MRIAIDVRSLMERKPSGVAEYTMQIIRVLAQLLPAQSVTTFHNSWSRARLPSLPRTKSVSWHYPNKLFNTSQLLLGRPHWSSLVAADVFFIPNVRLSPLPRHAPFVVTAHDLSFERFPEFYSAKRRAWHMLMRPRSLMRSADMVIAVSQATKRDVVELYGVAEDRVTVIHSGVSEPPSGWNGHQARDNVLRRHGITKPFILFVGTIEPRKNVVSVIEAFDAITDDCDQDLVLAGAPGWLTAEVEAAVRSARHRQRIHRLGHISDEEKWTLYATADLFVYPSFYEGFGFPPLEALLAGTPVITSHNSSLPEVVGEWADLINPYDPSELALVMQEVLRDPPIISSELKSAIRQRFNWQTAAKDTLRVLREVS